MTNTESVIFLLRPRLQRVAPVWARGTTATATDEVRHFVQAVSRCRAYYGTGVRRPESDRNRSGPASLLLPAKQLQFA
jgi:hypothetical protein